MLAARDGEMPHERGIASALIDIGSAFFTTAKFNQTNGGPPYSLLNRGIVQ
jgi:hypothetical protein